MGLGLIDYNQLKGSNTIIKQKLNEKQDTLVSGENIKTINGNSLIGAGNIVIDSQSGLSETDVRRIIIQVLLEKGLIQNS